VTRADGIPLYAVETVRMLLAQGRLVLVDGVYRPVDDLADLAVPETLTALIAARLDELDAADRGLVADAAVLGQSFTLAGVSAVSGVDPARSSRASGRSFGASSWSSYWTHARRNAASSRSWQALIREVAYNTLAKKDRKVRHLAAARFFETLDTEELAGALAGHYLAAQRYAADGPEADALAAQARVALRGAADRAAGSAPTHSHRVPRTRLAVTSEPADSGRPARTRPHLRHGGVGRRRGRAPRPRSPRCEAGAR